MATTKIEWTRSADGTSGRTWNPIRARLKESVKVERLVGTQTVAAGKWGYHCERVSPECSNCYACTMNGRTLPVWGTGLDYTRQSRDKVEIYLDKEELLKPLHWKAPRKIFPCSMTDLFAGFVPDEFIESAIGVMALCQHHTFQALTKRAARMHEWFTGELPLSSRQEVVMAQAAHTGNVVWDARGSERYNYFGCGRIGDISNRRPWPGWPLPNVWIGVSVGDRQRYLERVPLLRQTPAAVRWLSIEPLLEDLGPIDLTGIDWVVCGGESGRGARPMNPKWVRSIRDQCVASGVPFFFKQNGEYVSVSEVEGAGSHFHFADGSTVRRVGKKLAGRLLDGREWNEMPGMETK